MRTPPISEYRGIRGGDRGGGHDRSLNAREVLQDTVSTSDTKWKREEYTDKSGQRMIRMTRG